METLKLLGGNPWNPSEITKLDNELYEIKYSGIGIAIPGMKGNKELMLEYASMIEIGGAKDLPYQIEHADLARNGKLGYCNNGSMVREVKDAAGNVHSVEEMCALFNFGGLKEYCLPDDFDKRAEYCRNMIKDAWTIRNFVAEVKE